MVGIYLGHKLHWAEWLGVVVSFCGFVYLVLPDLTSPSLLGFVLMALAGTAWGFYTLAGKKSANPLSDTAYNFIRTLPLVILMMALTIQDVKLSSEGIILAIVSGGITSGIGYSLWYLALGGISAIQAAVVQLLVPVLAGLGGILFADEVLTVRLITSSVIILGGILMVILGKSYLKNNTIDN